MRLALMCAAAALALSACGQRGDLVRAPAEPGPAVPTGETVAPAFPELTSPSAQARPERSDEVLRRSEERSDDEYDLPPA